MIALYIIIGAFIVSLVTLFAIGLVKAGSDADKAMEKWYSSEERKNAIRHATDEFDPDNEKVDCSFFHKEETK